ncbi:hypothetical protein BH10PSE16_BH10PSE16_40790 [soil metagenome]
MGNDKASKTPNFEKRATGIMRDLIATNRSSLNRQLAIEAMMDALLARVPREVLPGLLEEYEAGCDRLAARLPPAMQEPALWEHWSDAISARQERLHIQHQKAC